MLKIAFLIRDLNFGGAQKQLLTLVKGINQQNFDVTVLYFYSGGALEKDLKDNEIKLICLEKRQRWDVFGFFSRLVQHLKHIQPDVLHGYLGESNLLTIFLKPFFPSTRMIWGVRESGDASSNLYGWLGRFLSQLEYILAPWSDLIVFNSHAGKDYYLDHGVPANKIMVIPNGIDTECFKPDPESRAKVRLEWGIPENTILIGLVGRLDPRKDHPTFLRAAALLCQEIQDLRFVCVGGTKNQAQELYQQELYQLTEELGISERVIWAGARADMPAVHNALDISVSSSYTEGFPNVIGEAMSCGVPCVVTDVGDSAWIVGDSSLIVAPRDPEALKKCIHSLIENLGTNNYSKEKIRQQITENFSVFQLVLKTEAVFLRLSHESSCK
ncbi:MAG: glycosyltransferase [Aulosira sp. ZfuVER01]|nr:glycosyltransferase [Aulosira sp. ZfuVER01]MDZ7998061.1 glycosyltransferase [Aulosira sp. DedVER01a]MDZ8050455.1 glycosyltransferase [Aulosira sp. ZfuCHP01]